MTDFSAEELLHERRMSDDGADKYHSIILRAREHGIGSVTQTGRALLRHNVEPVTEYVKEFLKEAEERPGKHHAAAPLLSLVKPDLSAFLALSVVVDKLYLTERKTTKLAFDIASLIELEWRAIKIKQRDKSFWKDITKQTKQMTAGKRRDWILQRAKSLGILPSRWARKTKLQLGMALLDAILTRTKLIFIHKQWNPERTKSISIIEPTDDVLDWLAKADDQAAIACAIYRPTIEEPLPWADSEGGGYLTDLVLRRGICRFRGKGHEKLVLAKDPEEYSVTLKGLNKLQSVPWRVNTDIIETVEHSLREFGAPLDTLIQLPLFEPYRPVDDSEEEKAKEHTSKVRYRFIKNINRGRASNLIANLRTAATARGMGDQEFWLPHRLDFRGRAYPTPTWLHPQGPDVARGLLRFSESLPMTADGWTALMAWGKETGDDLACLDVARAVTSDPLVNTTWASASKPWQFLAWCLEVGNALDTGYPERSFLTSLPVYVDASNNGLQLYSLLTGCRDLAKWTNVLPGDKQDLYTHVAAIAWRHILTLEGDDVFGAYARDLINIFGDEGIPRSCAKRPVMTMPYNVTAWSAADYVRDWYAETYCTEESPWGPLEYPQKTPRFLAAQLMAAVETACSSAVAGMRWLGAAALACADRGVPFRWTTPAGWPAQQEYRHTEQRRVRALLGGSMSSLTYRTDEGPVDSAKQARASAPNYVHGIDSSIMATAVAAFDGPVAAVHDAFGTLAPLVPNLHRGLRESVVSVCVERSPFAETKAEVESYIGRELPPVPVFGTIKAEEVLASEHFFG